MYILNKIVGGVLNPIGVGLLAAVCGLIMVGFVASPRLRHWGQGLMVFVILWLYVWSTGAMGKWIGCSLEREFPQIKAEEMPAADAIVILGGGMGANTNACLYAELWGSADRVWHGARLFRAGKAPKIYVTGGSVADSTVPFLVDLGVPREVIVCGDEPRNTEEEARFIAESLLEIMNGEGETRDGCPKILLVTSAWHMRRAKLMFERYARGVEIIPAATDHESMVLFERPLTFADFVPDPNMLGHNSYRFKEIIGYYGYKMFRK